MCNPTLTRLAPNVRDEPPPTSAARRVPNSGSAPAVWRSARSRGWASLNHLVSAHEDRLGDDDSERLSSLEVHHQLELARLLDRQIARLDALQDLVDVSG